MSKNIFVFVVCGDAVHIETLHLSLKYLKNFSKNEIIVVTDSSRNETDVYHNQVIDVKVDEKYNNHQASIYLKTGLYKFLPRGNNYCYLDTDVIALSYNCDNIFNEFISPITFAPDHCKVKKFSAYAVNCTCAGKWKKNRDLFEKANIEYNKTTTIADPYLNEQARVLQLIFDDIKKSLLLKAINALKFFISYPRFKLNKNFYFDRVKRTWHISTGEVVLYEVNTRKIEQFTGLKFNKWNQKWFDKNGDDIWLDECNHLTDIIEQTFNITVRNKNWQHWNGGVFLFNDESHNFLDSWFSKTMHIFNMPIWKTRDQGTLIATVWEFGLSNHPTLSKQWNFIADYYNNGLMLDEVCGLITDDGFKTSYKPNFIHVYHNWGNQDWNIWKWLTKKQL
jgi:hypothetical protein